MNNKLINLVYECLENSSLTFAHIYGLNRLTQGEALSVDLRESLIKDNILTDKGYWTDYAVSEYSKFNFELVQKFKGNTSESFDEWWNAYPVSDGHSHFPTTRPIRTNKTRCQELYQQILVKGIYTAEELLEALKKEVQNRKMQSLQRNELSLMVNPARYLEEGYYEAWTAQNDITGGYESNYNQNLL